MSGASGRILSPVETEAAVVRAAAAAPRDPPSPRPSGCLPPRPHAALVLRRRWPRARKAWFRRASSRGGRHFSLQPGGLDSAGGGPGY